jgi:CSLREA domain-containing protein
MKLQVKPLILVLFGLLIFALSSCTPIPVCAPTYNVTKTADTNDGVCSAGDCSLREAVLNANACPGSHTINLPAGGYILTLDGDDEDLGETGDLDITDDVTIIGSGAPSIHGGIERSFHIHSGANVVFDHIWLADGSAIYGGGLVNEGVATLESFTCNYNTVAIPPGGMGDAMGGCIFNTGDLTIQGGQFLANTAATNGFGGAIYNYDNATLTIENADFTGNVADTHGGAIWNGPNATVDYTGGTLRSNEAGLHGGGVWNNGTFEGSYLYFEENSAAGNGGGLFNWHDGFAVLSNNFLTENTADLGGGAFNSEGMLHFYESGLTANTATGGAGGGVYNMGPAAGAGLLMNNVTVSGNSAPGGPGGAGIYNTSNLMLTFITIAENSPEGIRVDGGSEIKIRSSALSNNSGGNCAGLPLDSLGHNIENDGSCAFTGWDDLPSTDPLLEPLAYYAGIAPSHALGLGSPAIDTGDPDKCTAIDQHGTTRPQGAWCDRGAHENLYTKGIVRGWTYIDANRDEIRDPGEGAVSGVILELKEGPCPGGAIAGTTSSSSPDGFYEIIDIEPGDYCIDTSSLQQTLYPEYIDLSFAAGDVLEDINFRYLLSPLGNATASGLVWHDECAVPYGTPPTPPPGCITLPGGGLGADGIYNPAEPGIEGLKVSILSGTCAFGPAALAGVAYTDVNGEYSFPGLTAGEYCLEVTTLTPNDTILIPGNWTYPVRDAVPAVHQFSLSASESLAGLNFGWDYQFLPAPFMPITFRCPVISDAFIRLGSTMQHPEIHTILQGEIFEVLARSDPAGPPWFFGRTASGEMGWLFGDLVAGCEDLDPDGLFVRESPPIPLKPTKTPIPLICTPELNENKCLKAGGKYIQINDKLWMCYCR